MKKILILTNYPIDLKSFTGGVETATAALLDGLQKYQTVYKFYVCALNLKGKSDLEVIKNNFHFFFITPFFQFLRPRSFWAGLKIFNIIKKIKPDLIQVNGNVILGFFALFSRKKKVYSIHGIPKKEKSVWSGKDYAGIWLESLLQKFVFNSYKNVIILSVNDKVLLKPDQNAFIIPNAVREQFLNDNINNRKNKNRILFIGRLSRAKGLNILLDVFEELYKYYPEYILTLIGDSYDDFISERITKLREASQSKIQVFSNQGVDDLIKFYRESVVFVLPSLQENMPITILEAMAKEVLVIAANVGAVKEIIEDSVDGFLFSPGNKTELFNKLKCVLDNRNELSDIINNAKQKVVNKFSPEYVASMHLKTYEQIIL